MSKINKLQITPKEEIQIKTYMSLFSDTIKQNSKKERYIYLKRKKKKPRFIESLTIYLVAILSLSFLELEKGKKKKKTNHGKYNAK